MAISLFGGITPVQLNETDSSIYTMGTRFFSDVAGTIDAISYWKGSTQATWDTRIVRVGIWDATTQALLGSGSREQLATDVQGPILVPLTTAVHIDADTDYIVGYLNPATGHYVDSADFFATQHDSGVLHAYATSVKPNGVLHVGTTLTYPEASSNGFNWFTDINFTADGPTGVEFAGVALSMPIAADPGTWTGTQQVTWQAAPLSMDMPASTTQRLQSYQFTQPALSMPAGATAGTFTGGQSATFTGAALSMPAEQTPGVFTGADNAPDVLVVAAITGPAVAPLPVGPGVSTSAAVTGPNIQPLPDGPAVTYPALTGPEA